MSNPNNIQVIKTLTTNSAIKTILYIIAFMVLIGQAFVLTIYLTAGMNVEFFIMLSSMIPIFIALGLNYRNNTQAAGSILAITLTILITILATIGAGIYDIGVIAYPAILIIASLTLRKNTTYYLTILIIICVAWLVFGTTLGLYEPRYPAQTYNRQFFLISVILIITAFAVQILSRTIQGNMIAIKHELNERKIVEEALLEAKELYRNIVESTSVVTYRDTAELESATTYISPQINSLLGYSQSEWKYDPKLWLKITHPDDLPLVRAMIAKCLQTGERTVSEYRMLSKNGDWVWLRDECILIKDESGNPQYIHGVLIEITDRKEAEQKVHQREAILGAVAETAQHLLKALDWRKEVNTILRLLGNATGASHVYIFENYPGTAGVMLSSQTYEWAAPGIKPEIDNPVYQNARLIPSVPGLEDWYSNLSNGKPFYGSKSQYPRYWKKVFEERGLKTLLDVPILANGNWWGIIGFDDFVNEKPWSQAEIDALVAAAGNLGAAIERQQAYDALRASEEKFQHTFHHTYVCMAINRTSSNTLLDVNDSFCKITGYTREEAVGKRAGHDLNIWVHHEDRNHIIDTLNKQGFVDEYRAEFRRKNGEVGIGLLSAVNVNIAGENCQLYTFYDISRIDQLLNELQAKNEELQNFTYTVSHDLKAPLVTIAGFMGYLAKDTRDGDLEKVDKDILRITEAVARMQRLLNELLELSRIGRLMNTPEVVPFGEIVDEALRLVEGRLKERQVEVLVEAELPSVYGDRERLVEVVQNLVDNAAKFMGDQSTPLVEIGVTNIHGDQTFYVHDNGMGIEPEQHERVFGLFNKLNTQTEGTGIGLALVKRIVEVHGGRIWLESDGQGNGTTFYFTLAKSQETKA